MNDDCPLKRCDGHLEVWASGTDDAGRPTTFALCDRCGKVVERDAPADERQQTLFGGEG